MKRTSFLYLVLFILFSCNGNEAKSAAETENAGHATQENTKLADDTAIGRNTTEFVLGNEEVIYSFETKKGKKMVVVKNKNNAYIQYRFGSKGKIEMEFPAEKTKESWKQFKYNSYWRGGGKENAGMEIDNLQFTNKGYTYLIYRTYFAESEENSAGIIITDSNKKETRINGVPKTINGCICNLEDTGLIEKTDIGLSF